MYNRYVPNDSGQYRCIREWEEDDRQEEADSRSVPPFTAPSGPRSTDGPEAGTGGPRRRSREADGPMDSLHALLNQFHLGDLDTGDLLLLAILFLLFREGEDQELLLALGLLLIL